MSTRRKKSSLKNIFFNLFLVLLLIVGLALVFNNQIKNLIVRWMSDDSRIENVSRSEIEANLNKDANFDFDSVVSLDLETVVKSSWYKDQQYVVGGIAIPSLKLNLPIFKGVSNYSIAAGAGTMKEEQRMGEGNYALASHDMIDNRTLFGPLKLLPNPKTSQEEVIIYLTDLEYVYEYKMIENFIVQPSQSEVIDDVENKRLLTLVTCAVEGTERQIVQGELIKKVPVKDASKEANDAFNLEQLTL